MVKLQHNGKYWISTTAISGKELRIGFGRHITGFLPVVIKTAYFCVVPVWEKAERRGNKLKSMHRNRQHQDVLCSLPITCPASAWEICLKSSLISIKVPCEKEEVRWPESCSLCTDFQARLKWARWGFAGTYLVGKESFFFKIQRKRILRRQPTEAPWWKECCFYGMCWPPCPHNVDARGTSG